MAHSATINATPTMSSLRSRVVWLRRRCGVPLERGLESGPAASKSEIHRSPSGAITIFAGFTSP